MPLRPKAEGATEFRINKDYVFWISIDWSAMEACISIEKTPRDKVADFFPGACGVESFILQPAWREEEISFLLKDFPYTFKAICDLQEALVKDMGACQIKKSMSEHVKCLSE